MKKNFKPNTWLYPQPVLVIASYGADGTADGMVVAWGGIYDTNRVGFMLDHTHKTVANLLEKKAFTVSMATVSTMAEADYLGIVSGNRVPDKVARAGLHAVKSEFVDAPVLSEFPLTLECKVSKVTKVGEDYHFVGDIVNILVDEDILTDGKIDVKKLQAITFDPAGGKYIALGDAVGNAYQEGRRLWHDRNRLSWWGKPVRCHQSNRFFTLCHCFVSRLSHKAFLPPFRMTIGGKGVIMRRTLVVIRNEM